MTTEATLHPFEYVRPSDQQVEDIAAVREALYAAYEVILERVPECAERTLAWRRLEEASMWANKAIVFDGQHYLA